VTSQSLLPPAATRPEAVLLDAGGVLLLPNPWAVAAVLRAAGGSVDIDVIPRAHYAGTAAMDASRRLADWSRYFAVLARFAGVLPDRHDDAIAGLAALFGAPVPTLWNVVPDGVLEALRELDATGVAIAVVSNADGLVEAELRRAGVQIELVIDSTVVGVSKPDPEIFQLALNKLGVAPQAAVHIGDTASADVVGAIAAGVRPLHLDPFGDCPYPVGHHEHIRSLADVVAIIAAAPRGVS
jgi:putative hydrolase of the HAD superfamily